MNKKLYVGGLSYSVTDSQLKAMFDSHGTVESAKVITDRDSDRSRGFGFVEMGTQEEAEKAIAALNGTLSRPVLGIAGYGSRRGQVGPLFLCAARNRVRDAFEHRVLADSLWGRRQARQAPWPNLWRLRGVRALRLPLRRTLRLVFPRSAPSW
jgi:hypothetical protein